jgi:hypothetical protein
MCKEAVVAYFNALFRYSPKAPAKKMKNLSGEPELRLETAAASRAKHCLTLADGTDVPKRR